MSNWPFKHLTIEKAWGYVRAAGEISVLDDLSNEAKLELAGLSAFGQSGDQAETLSLHVDPITLGGYPPRWDPEHVRSGLIRLGFPESDRPRRRPTAAGEQTYRHFAGPACDPEKAATALSILRRRDPNPTDVHLAGGRILRVYNVAWGRDIGDEYDHVTTNISPEPAVDHTVDFFYTSEITALIDPDSGAEIWP